MYNGYVELANAVVFQAVCDVAENECKRFFYGNEIPEAWYDGIREDAEARASKKTYPLIQAKGIFPTKEDYVRSLVSQQRKNRLHLWQKMERDAKEARMFLTDRKRLAVFTAVESEVVMSGTRSMTRRLITDTFEKLWEMAERKNYGTQDFYRLAHRRYRRISNYNSSESNTGD